MTCTCKPADYVPSPLGATGDRLLTVHQAAELLACSTTSVRRLIGRGELASQRIGRSRGVRVTAASVAAYIEGDRRGSEVVGTVVSRSVRPPLVFPDEYYDTPPATPRKRPYTRLAR